MVRIGPVSAHSAIMPFALTSGQWFVAYFGSAVRSPPFQKNALISPTQSAHHFFSRMSF